MSIKINEISYLKFNPDERFRLALASLARDDQEELDHLWRSCDTFTYRARDLDYQARFRAINLISNLFFQNVVYYYNHINNFETLLLLNEHCKNIIIAPLDEKEVAKHQEKRQKLICQLKSVYAGLKLFCQEVDLNFDDLLKIIEIKEVCFDIERYLSLEVGENEECTLEFKNKFLEYWGFKN